MQIVDEYSGAVYFVPPEEETIVAQLQLRGATTPEIVEALSLPTPEAGPEESHAYLPATDGGVIDVREVPELNETDNALD